MCSLCLGVLPRAERMFLVLALPVLDDCCSCLGVFLVLWGCSRAEGALSSRATCWRSVARAWEGGYSLKIPNFIEIYIVSKIKCNLTC